MKKKLAEMEAENKYLATRVSEIDDIKKQLDALSWKSTSAKH
ncbi:MAG: hypothetical protein PXY39_07740 [archaeon]|nr:hypothetical protein [archaeon]